MNFATLGLAATIALATTSLALAQETVRLDDLDVDRLNDTQVIVEFEYDGSACEAVGTAEVGALTDGTLAVSFPTSNTAEVCTQQLVEIEVEQAITVPEGATHVEVTLLSPDGSVKATGTDRIDHD
jgi:archaellum component FlaF (FlaF/FlaG flagellin family)